MRLIYLDQDKLEYVGYNSYRKNLTYKKSVCDLTFYIDYFNKINKYLVNGEKKILYCMKKGKNKVEISKILDIPYSTLCHKFNKLIKVLNIYYIFDKKNDLDEYRKFLKYSDMLLVTCILKRLSLVKTIKSIRNNLHGKNSVSMIKWKKVLMEDLKINHNNWYNFIKEIERW